MSSTPPPIYTQPVAQAPMLSIFPESSRGPQGNGEWSTGLFECDAGSFCFSCWWRVIS